MLMPVDQQPWRMPADVIGQRHEALVRVGIALVDACG
jgi:hypothetical protein